MNGTEGEKAVVQKPRWIPFRGLVRSDNTFEPCPNCGRGRIVTPAFKGLMPMVCDPKCPSCGWRFKLRRRWFFFRGFDVLSPSAYEALTAKEATAS